jgi:hypothetical protein
VGSSPEREWRGGEGQGVRLAMLEVGVPWGVAALERAADRLLIASVLFVQTAV